MKQLWRVNYKNEIRCKQFWEITRHYQYKIHLKSVNHLGAIHKLRHMNFMIFLHLSPLVTGGHISEIPPPSVSSHILQF